MSTQPLGMPRFRAFDSNGDPLSGGKLYTYSAGTTTPLSSYTTRAGNVANANPVVLDADGGADVWMSPGVDYKFVLKNSLDVIQWTVDNFPSPQEQTASTDVAANEPGGRLTLTAGTPVTTGNVTGATTVYYVPYASSKVPLFDGTTWSLFDIGSSGLSQTTLDNTKSPAAVANNSVYDLFIWNDSGTVRLSRGPLWTSDTARGTGAGTTELQQVNGRWVNKVSITSGPAAQCGLYVGTIRSDGSAQINDSLTKRHVWNTHHRVARTMRATDAASTWGYNTGTLRQANANAANQLDYVQGLSEDPIKAHVSANGANDTVAVGLYVGIGVDSTTVNSAQIYVTGLGAAATSGANGWAMYEGLPGIGRHALVWLESAVSGSGNTTWWGTQAGQRVSGIHGEVMG